LGTGTADNSTFLRGDGTWASPGSSSSFFITGNSGGGAPGKPSVWVGMGIGLDATGAGGPGREPSAQWIAPVAVTVTRGMCSIGATAGQAYTFNIYNSSNAQVGTWSCTIANGGLSGTATGSSTLAAGSQYAILMTSAGNAANTNYFWQIYP
jgi:hypothetical protein